MFEIRYKRFPYNSKHVRPLTVIPKYTRAWVTSEVLLAVFKPMLTLHLAY